MRKINVFEKDIEELKFINIKRSINGTPCLPHEESKANQFNLEMYFDESSKGFGFRSDLTKKDVGEILVQFGLDLIKECK